VTKVVFTEPASQDLIDIEYYIYAELYNPQAAKRITDGILETIEHLKKHPTRHKLIKDSILKNAGLRRIPFENYNIFYYYNLNQNVVYIIRILYNRVDWKSIL
jgi:toxin ParE1/3/4